MDPPRVLTRGSCDRRRRRGYDEDGRRASESARSGRYAADRGACGRPPYLAERLLDRQVGAALRRRDRGLPRQGAEARYAARRHDDREGPVPWPLRPRPLADRAEPERYGAGPRPGPRDAEVLQGPRGRAGALRAERS